ncbi:tyrosine protein phosphatase [Pullulanibacillus sp. KACC 23026]|uniref:tyrosine-protein phosphatase n=1 Tax=Pullulanibacillus sp. KACC 23026 TaxID=3028315 RepID=UPI0023B164CF|nr:CpsB/CapC family capsule biosynthesis tyrosine phosphatase [Pullulanibacillus sp. KACC 23026]WEG13150.1 tyrosine protein phosphatase [Pullulanibacillus sp. KACC 23026]
MIDIHNHILPNLDDGPQAVEDALEMARSAFSQGITQIVATPHHNHPMFNNPRSKVLEAVDFLNDQLKREAMDLSILPGQECRISGEIIEDYQNAEILSVNENGKYLLIEFPSNHVPRYTERLFYDIQVSGLIPVIVHPERNSEIIQNPDRLYELVKGGALSQVTAGSLIGNFGKKIGRFSLQLVESGLSHIVGSDAHNVTTRGFCLREAYETIEDQFGIGLRMEFEENANLMVQGEALYLQPPTPIRQKRFLGLF